MAPSLPLPAAVAGGVVAVVHRPRPRRGELRDGRHRDAAEPRRAGAGPLRAAGRDVGRAPEAAVLP
ncbi:hypothetical protein THAOC_08987, partial [Thalassiosira oceanica]